MSTIKAQPARGMRDLLPVDARRRLFVVDTLRALFETYGFEPLETPAMEQAETVLGKYGPDAERLIYRAGLGSSTDLALRYDLTVSLARVCAANETLPRPFKRYQIAPVWRGERPQRGRYREFVQADIDIVGSRSILADAEIITIAATALEHLGFDDHRTMVNNRKVIAAIGQYAGVPASLLPGLYRAIDKRDKIGLDGVRLELRAVGLPGDLINRQRQGVERYVRGKADADRLARDLAEAVGDDAPAGVKARALPAFLAALDGVPTGGGDAAVAPAQTAVMSAAIDALRDVYPPDALIPDPVTARLLDLVALRGENRALIADLRARLGDPAATEGLDELAGLLDALEAAGVPTDRIAVDFAMVRGLDYYTGTIFETLVDRVPTGSILGGGRYDRLVGLFGRDLPAVGTSFGVDRFVVVMEDAGLFPPGVDAPTPLALVARFDAVTTPDAVRLAQSLRAEGVATDLYFDADRIGDQIRYAARRGIGAVVIVGPDELAAGVVTVRDLAGRTEQRVPIADVAAAVRAIAAGQASRSAGTP
jgi:histidyl-tRNA synthetase